MLSKESKIYVAGHNGLVGSAIWNNLKSRGYNNLIGRSHKELDLTDQNAVKKFFDEEQPDAVVLAAAFVGGIMANMLYRADFIMMNMKIQCNVISEAYAHGVKKLLFLGSTCIYPKNAPQPMKEDCLLTSPLEYTNEEYAIAKIAGLKMCESYNLQYGTNYIAVMPTNLYGPNDNFHLENSHVMPAMMRKVYLAKLIHDGAWDKIRRDLAIRPVGANIKENGEQVRYVIDGNSDEALIRKILAWYGIEDNKVTKICNIPFGTSYKDAKNILTEKYGSYDYLASTKDCIIYRHKSYAGSLFTKLLFMFQSDGENSYFNKAVLCKETRTKEEAVRFKHSIDDRLSKQYQIYNILDDDSDCLSLGGICPVPSDGIYGGYAIGVCHRVGHVGQLAGAESAVKAVPIQVYLQL